MNEPPPNGPNELYHLKEDPKEVKNLVADESSAETRQRLQARLADFFARFADSRYDLWRGGGSKAVRLIR